MDHSIFYQPALPFPLRIVRTAQGLFRIYDIPDGRKVDVLRMTYPFFPLPRLDDVMEDVHTGKTFKVREFIVAREGGLNVLAGPYYFEAGGTVIDWWPVDEDDLGGEA
jgi:hypothetical protein